jgi:hypothetical protein
LAPKSARLQADERQALRALQQDTSRHASCLSHSQHGAVQRGKLPPAPPAASAADSAVSSSPDSADSTADVPSP